MTLGWKCANYSTITKIMLNSWRTCDLVVSQSFHIFGWVSWHNYQIWGKSNPAAILEHEPDSPKLVVGCVMSSTGLNRPFLFHNASRKMTIFTGKNYLRMLQEFAVPQLQARSDLVDVLFRNKTAYLPALSC